MFPPLPHAHTFKDFLPKDNPPEPKQSKKVVTNPFRMAVTKLLPAPRSPCHLHTKHPENSRWPPHLSEPPSVRQQSSLSWGRSALRSAHRPAMPRRLCALLLLASQCLASAAGLFPFGEPDFSYKRSNCKPIPAPMLLCRGIEYQSMRLPNLLGHETVQEVLEQASTWIPLVQKQCHPDTRKFLCSLFAPVCIDDLDEIIQPCHSLCEEVKESCAPVMSAFGFPWPDMLDCSRFPKDNDLCIPLASSDHILPVTREAPKVCDACKNKNEDDNDIMENLCKNDFALKIKVKEIAYINGDTKITPETKSKTIYKLNGLTERDLRKIVLWLKGGLQCTCDEMNDINVPYLVMGQKQAGELVITSLKRWQKGQRAFKRFSRSIRKLQC
ncbi:secreted frizzled-related protein 2 [Tympanuchus pallidicinctus]|uniref:secreted frizzled-related protein 2 n=2 Tax=Tetraoninae TaxID=466585 RepID=UPI002286EEF8|nr:secreted frizzled-related protein 2 [Tympanuchus pallidicinctus]